MRSFWSVGVGEGGGWEIFTTKLFSFMFIPFPSVIEVLSYQKHTFTTLRDEKKCLAADVGKKDTQPADYREHMHNG